MAGKRSAASDLNHDNWDDYEPEEAGTFQKASQDVLQRRVIKTARRRRPIGVSFYFYVVRDYLIFEKKMEL